VRHGNLTCPLTMLLGTVKCELCAW
jgi:hypothetical protein